MKLHYHTAVDHIVLSGLYALIFLNLWRMIAAFLTQRENRFVHSAGTAMGALVHFGGK